MVEVEVEVEAAEALVLAAARQASERQASERSMQLKMLQRMAAAAAADWVIFQEAMVIKASLFLSGKNDF